MDTDTQELVTTIVEEFVHSDRLFTVHDVTVEARTRTSVNVKHNEVRDLVHPQMQPYVSAGVYSVSELDVNTNVKPLLYHPSSKLPSDYSGRGASAGGRFGTLANRPPAGGAAALGGDKRGRVCVPNKLVQDIGLRHGMRAYVTVEQKRIVIHRTTPPAFKFSYLVDKDNNIRVGRQVLEAADLLNQPHSFSLNGDSICLA